MNIFYNKSFKHKFFAKMLKTFVQNIVCKVLSAKSEYFLHLTAISWKEKIANNIIIIKIKWFWNNTKLAEKVARTTIMSRDCAELRLLCDVKSRRRETESGVLLLHFSFWEHSFVLDQQSTNNWKLIVSRWMFSSLCCVFGSTDQLGKSVEQNWKSKRKSKKGK